MLLCAAMLPPIGKLGKSLRSIHPTEVQFMDDRRFDMLARSLASGMNRRTMLKGVLGLGTGAVVGSAAMAGDAEAARRGYSGPRFPTLPPGPCTPRCDGTTCGSDGCGGTCSCPEQSCACLADQGIPNASAICVSEWSTGDFRCATDADCTDYSPDAWCDTPSGRCWVGCS